MILIAGSAANADRTYNLPVHIGSCFQDGCLRASAKCGFGKRCATTRGLSAHRFPIRVVSRQTTRRPWAHDEQIGSDCDARTSVSQRVLCETLQKGSATTAAAPGPTTDENYPALRSPIRRRVTDNGSAGITSSPQVWRSYYDPMARSRQQNPSPARASARSAKLLGSGTGVAAGAIAMAVGASNPEISAGFTVAPEARDSPQAARLAAANRLIGTNSHLWAK
jgi:hypothetical protein